MASTISSKKKPQSKNPLINKMPFSLCNSKPSIEDRIKSLEGQMKFELYEQAFMLRRLSKYCYRQNVIAQFAPDQFPDYEFYNQEYKPNYPKQLLKDPKHKKLHAVYNKDKRYYSPAFVIGIDLRDYFENPVDDLKKFKQRVEFAKKLQSDDTESMYVPKHAGSKCQICKQQYGEYKEHTTSEKHLKIMRKSLGYKLINQFVSAFNKNKKLSTQKKMVAIKQKNKKKKQSQNQKLSSQIHSPPRQKQKMKTKLIAKNIFDTPKKKRANKTNKTPGTSANNSTISQKFSSVN